MKIPETYAELRAMPKEQIPLLWLQITRNPTNLSPKNLVRPLRYRIQCTRYTNTCNATLSADTCLSNFITKNSIRYYEWQRTRGRFANIIQHRRKAYGF